MGKSGGKVTILLDICKVLGEDSSSLAELSGTE
jgi:hypothetical protein